MALERTIARLDPATYRSNVHTVSSQPLKSKLALGTVQLGLPYGINNMAGKPDLNSAFAILDRARSSGIQILDTAEAYGDSIQVIGQYIRQRKAIPLKIVSKFIADEKPLQMKVERQLRDLSIEQLYGLMYHRFADYASQRNREELVALKNQGKVGKVGVSLYATDELRTILADPMIDILQLPFNVLDADPEKKELMKKAHDSQKEVHVRSVFLQGIFFKDPQSLTGNLDSFKETLKELYSIVDRHRLNVRQLCLNYVLRQDFVDVAVVGVETVEQLEENLNSVLPDLPENVIRELESMTNVDSRLLNPSHWKP